MNRIKFIINVILIGCFISYSYLVYGATTQKKDERDKSDKEILTHLKTVLWPQAYRQQDTGLLNRILAEEFQMISDKGEWSGKADEMAYIARHKPTYKSFTFQIKRLDIFENDTAVVAGIGIIKNSDNNGPYVVTYHSSNVLIKRMGQWKAIASHVSGVKKVRQSNNE